MKDPIRYLGNWEDNTFEEVESYALSIKHVELSTLDEVLETMNG